LVITDEADWAEFERLAETIRDGFEAQIIERLDGLDERYWDLEISGQTITLHLQHFLGICVFAESAEAEPLVREIGAFLEAKGR